MSEGQQQVIWVPMDGIGHLRFAERPGTILATKDLNGCHAVIVLTPSYCIMAHIAPYPGLQYQDPYAGDNHVAQKMDEFIGRYMDLRAPPGQEREQTFTVHAIVNDAIGSPSQVQIIRSKIEQVGWRDIRVASYRGVNDPSGQHPPARGTIWIRPPHPPSNFAQVYVEGKPWLPEPTSQPGSSFQAPGRGGGQSVNPSVFPPGPAFQPPSGPPGYPPSGYPPPGYPPPGYPPPGYGPPGYGRQGRGGGWQ